MISGKGEGLQEGKKLCRWETWMDGEEETSHSRCTSLFLLWDLVQPGALKQSSLWGFAIIRTWTSIQRIFVHTFTQSHVTCFCLCIKYLCFISFVGVGLSFPLIKSRNIVSLVFQICLKGHSDLESAVNKQIANYEIEPKTPGANYCLWCTQVSKVDSTN